MRVILIYPPCFYDRPGDEDHTIMPIGLYYIASYLLENGHKVSLINGHNVSYSKEYFCQLIQEEKPDVVGFSVFNANRVNALKGVKWIKHINRQIITIFGGVAATFMAEDFLTYCKELDYVVCGEGEITLLELVNCLQSKDRNIEQIKGLAFRQKDEVIFTPSRGFISDLDSLPNPAKYFTYNHVLLSRGCPYNCSFCASPRFWQRRCRFHSPAYFVEQLKLLYSKGVNFFYVSDDTFTFKKEYVLEVCERICKEKLPINWFAISRVDALDEEIVKAMRKAGCIQISFGLESGSLKIRNIFNKHIKEEDAVKSFYLCKKYSILPRAYFIYGSPGENEQTIEETLNLIEKIKPINSIFYILHLFPGTKLYDEFRTKNLIKQESLNKNPEDILYFELDPNLTKTDILRFGKKLRNYFYSNLPRYVLDMELSSDKEFYPHHADFLSRLAMTFSHGDFAQNKYLKNQEEVAWELFVRSLKFSITERAFLGLGILAQKRGDYKNSISILQKGLKYFPKSKHLKMCLGVSYLNCGDKKNAKECFKPFVHIDPKAKDYLRECR